MNRNDLPYARLLKCKEKTFPIVNKPQMGLLLEDEMKGRCLEAFWVYVRNGIQSKTNRGNECEGWIPAKWLKELYPNSPILFNI